MRNLAGIFVSLALFAPAAAFADSEMHFLPNGSITGKGILVMQKTGNNLFSRGVWGQSYIRFVILTNKDTKITKNHGEPATIADMNEQDVIDIEGSLQTGADSILIIAKSIHDTSLDSASKTLSGTVASVSSSGFTLTNKSYGKTAVTTAGAAITKGARSIALSEIRTGDKILSVAGTYDYAANALAATSVVVYQDESVFKARNFEGSLKSLAGTTLPTTAVVTVGATDYTVYLSEKTSVLKTSKAATSLARYQIGDKVRLYGVVRPQNLTEVDAEIIRDLNF